MALENKKAADLEISGWVCTNKLRRISRTHVILIPPEIVKERYYFAGNQRLTPFFEKWFVIIHLKDVF